MSTRYKFFDKQSCYFVTFAVVDWIDVFTRKDYRDIFVESIQYCITNKGLVVHGWVLMTNHVHMLVSLSDHDTGTTTLSDIMRDMKKYTAMQLIKNIRENPQESRQNWMMTLFEKNGKYNNNNTNFQFWQQDNHPIAVNDSARYSKALEYIHQNPVNAGWVTNPIHWPWSSAIDYEGGSGKTPVTILSA